MKKKGVCLSLLQNPEEKELKVITSSSLADFFKIGAGGGSSVW